MGAEQFDKKTALQLRETVAHFALKVKAKMLRGSHE